MVLAPAVDYLLTILQRASLLAPILHAVLSHLIKKCFINYPSSQQTNILERWCVHTCRPAAAASEALRLSAGIGLLPGHGCGVLRLHAAGVGLRLGF